jgi:hypothetical protein
VTTAHLATVDPPGAPKVSARLSGWVGPEEAKKEIVDSVHRFDAAKPTAQV